MTTYPGWIDFNFSQTADCHLHLRVHSYVPNYSVAGALFGKGPYRRFVASPIWGHFASNLREFNQEPRNGMRSKPSTASILVAVYLSIVLATAMAAFLPPSPNATAYLVLLVLTLPVSVVAMPVLFVTIGVTFSDSGSLWLRLLTIVLWMGFVVGELALLREIRRAFDRRRSLSA